MVERTVGEDILLDGCLHRALQREAGQWAATSTVPSAVTASGELLRHTNPALQAQVLTSGQGWLYNFPLVLRKLHMHQGKNRVSFESYLLFLIPPGHHTATLPEGLETQNRAMQSHGPVCCSGHSTMQSPPAMCDELLKMSPPELLSCDTSEALRGTPCPLTAQSPVCALRSPVLITTMAYSQEGRRQESQRYSLQLEAYKPTSSWDHWIQNLKRKGAC